LFQPWKLASPPFLPLVVSYIFHICGICLIPDSNLQMFRGDTSLIHLQSDSPLCFQKREVGTRKGVDLCLLHLIPQILFPSFCPPRLAHCPGCARRLQGPLESSVLLGMQKSLLPPVAETGHYIIPSTSQAWRKFLPGTLRTEVISLLPSTHMSGKEFKGWFSLLPPPQPCTSGHSRISYEKIGPNFIHPAARGLPCPQELLQLQDTGARRGFRVSPQFWERGLSHGPASPPLCLCSHSSLASPMSFLLPGEWQGQVGQE
jgi:hypothetical protein